MTFFEALKRVREGKSVLREVWVEANEGKRTEVGLWHSDFSWMEDRLLMCTYGGEDGTKVRILQPRPAGARSRGLAVGGRWAMYDIKDITPEEAERLLKELEKGADEELDILVALAGPYFTHEEQEAYLAQLAELKECGPQR